MLTMGRRYGIPHSHAQTFPWQLKPAFLLQHGTTCLILVKHAWVKFVKAARKTKKASLMHMATPVQTGEDLTVLWARLTTSNIHQKNLGQSKKTAVCHANNIRKPLKLPK